LPIVVSIAFLDELASALPSAGAPDVRASFPVAYAGLATALLSAPMVAAVVLEPLLLAASDRWRNTRVALASSLAVLAAAFALAAQSSSLVGVGLALAVAFPAMGVATSLAEASLIAVCTTDVERAQAMGRWSLAGALGDVAGPLVLALAFGWRGGTSIIAAAIALVALVVLLRPRDAAEGDAPSLDVSAADAEEDTGENDGTVGDGSPKTWIREVLGALRRPTLVMWLVATALCSLLDETLIAFAALHWDALAEANGYGRLTLGTMLAAFALGAALSLVVLDRVLVGVRSEKVLGIACGGVVVTYGSWLIVTGPIAGTALFFLAGVCAAPLWPLCQAKVYDLLPRRAGLANALSNVFSVIDIGAPVFLGVVADRVGVVVALSLLLAQPLAILGWVGWRARGAIGGPPTGSASAGPGDARADVIADR
jgi:MFS family permease